MKCRIASCLAGRIREVARLGYVHEFLRYEIGRPRRDGHRSVFRHAVYPHLDCREAGGNVVYASQNIVRSKGVDLPFLQLERDSIAARVGCLYIGYDTTRPLPIARRLLPAPDYTGARGLRERTGSIANAVRRCPLRRSSIHTRAVPTETLPTIFP